MGLELVLSRLLFLLDRSLGFSLEAALSEKKIFPIIKDESESARLVTDLC